ncbi:hypothetical protein DAI22_01g452050 [Oryza sativa Japonica Group]|nr:hypothetical protein DAI22_01g452050 [Oryza sativa Japonica Group]
MMRQIQLTLASMHADAGKVQLLLLNNLVVQKT